MEYCLACQQPLSLYQKKYCSNKCQREYDYQPYIYRWKTGQLTGQRGVNVSSLSRHIMRYLYEKYSFECANCGWNEINPLLGHSPLEVDHIDGDADNNDESNLILLCPNCHALTPTYRNLNKGAGRVWRREKYVKIGKLPL